MSVYVRPLTPDELMHYGVKGMKWGLRRYQNYDGTLTPAGARRLGKINTKITSNREQYKNAKRKFDKNNAKSRLLSGNKKASKYSKQMSRLDLKKDKLEKKKFKLTSNTNKPVEDIDYDKSTKSARATKKSLNYLEKQHSKQQANAQEFAARAKKAKDAGNTKKFENYRNKGAQYLNNAKNIESIKRKIIGKASEKGQEVQTTASYKKYVRSGRDTAALILGGLIASTVSIGLHSNERIVDENRWSVKNNKRQ